MEVASASGGFASSLTHGNVCVLALGIDVKAVIAGAIHGERQIRRINFKGIAVIQSAQVDVQRTLGKLNLYGAVVKIQEGNAGFTGKTQGRAANVQLAARIPVGPEIVTRGERPVGTCLHPVRLTAWLE